MSRGLLTALDHRGGSCGQACAWVRILHGLRMGNLCLCLWDLGGDQLKLCLWLWHVQSCWLGRLELLLRRLSWVQLWLNTWNLWLTLLKLLWLSRLGWVTLWQGRSKEGAWCHLRSHAIACYWGVVVYRLLEDRLDPRQGDVATHHGGGVEG